MSFHHFGGMDRRTLLASLPSMVSVGRMLTARSGMTRQTEENPIHDHPSPMNGPVWRRRGHIPVFDAHLHIPGDNGKHWQNHPVTPTGAQFVAYLEHCGVSRGVVNSVRSQVADSAAEMIAGNREVLRYRDRYPEMLVPACAVDFRFIEESLREMEDWNTRHGMVWVADFEFPPDPTPSVENLDRFMKQAAQLQMIVTITARREGVDWLVKNYADASIAFPQLELGKGSKVYSRLGVAGRPRNFYLDISPRGYERMGLIEQAAEWVGAAKLLFGSNFPVNSPAAVVARLDNAFLLEEQKQAIFSSNLEALLARAGWHF